jgi:hypothetical protein
MKSSCMQHPSNEPLIIIRKSQIEFCSGDMCAAALLSFFEYWHNIKLEMSYKNKVSNDVAYRHGEDRLHDETTLQFHSLEELSAGMLGLYSVNSIKKSKKLLVELGIIIEHKNPSDRYKFDRTIYYQFYPEIYNEWLQSREAKIDNSSVKIGSQSDKIGSQSAKIGLTITETSSETSSECLKEKVNSNELPPISHERIVEIYHEEVPGLSRVIDITPERKAMLKKLAPKIQTEFAWREFFEIVRKSDFLNGKNDRNWKANFSWLINYKNAVKVIEGNYNNLEAKKPIDWQDTSWADGLAEQCDNGYYGI